MILSRSNRRSGAFLPRPPLPSHGFAVGQAVRLKSTLGMSVGAADLFRVTATMPPRDGSPQYRIRNEAESYDRVTTEDALEAASSAPADERSQHAQAGGDAGGQGAETQQSRDPQAQAGEGGAQG